MGFQKGLQKEYGLSDKVLNEKGESNALFEAFLKDEASGAINHFLLRNRSKI